MGFILGHAEKEGRGGLNGGVAVHFIAGIFVFIYLPHDYNNYKEMPKNM